MPQIISGIFRIFIAKEIHSVLIIIKLIYKGETLFYFIYSIPLQNFPYNTGVFLSLLYKYRGKVKGFEILIF